MEVLLAHGKTDELSELLRRDAVADYVYMYPPRQTYRQFAADREILPLVERSLDRSDSVNLYFHFPFCRQICAFCNLFAVVLSDTESYDRYISCIERELDQLAPSLKGKSVRTIYLGGGTPSLLSVQSLDRILRRVEKITGCDVSEVPEVALEVSPETVELEKFRELRAIGVNRVNMGVQSTADLELHLIGRQYDSVTVFSALDIVQSLGFRNVCIDLIYGLEGQSLEAWQCSVREVIAREPETICPYALTLRPVTGFSARKYRYLSGIEQLAKYDLVERELAAAGYAQETHVRWTRGPNGGYLQKANHWGLENILGIGAGARSYLWELDTRNGYSVRNRVKAFREYLQTIEAGKYPVTDGFLMDDDERVRKAVVLGLFHLNRDWFKETFGCDPRAIFNEEFDVLEELGLVSTTDATIQLTNIGRRHRDVIVQAFFSDRVRELLSTFDYDE